LSIPFNDFSESFATYAIIQKKITGYRYILTDNNINGPSPKPRFFYGNVVVAASFIVMIIAQGIFIVFGLFINPLLDEFGWTSSKSYSKSYIYGITDGEWVYVVKCFTDSGRKDITRLDPVTGSHVGAFGTITTSDMYHGFTIHGDMVIYRTKVSKDLLGNRTGGGQI